MERHPDQIAREEFLNKSKMADNMKCCWAQSQEVKVHDNGIVETVYAPPPYPVYTSTPTPMYENFPKLLVKKLDPDAIIPTKANSSDAGYDLYALNGTIIEKNTHRLIKTGISMAIPEGHVGLIWPRSGLAYKHGLDVFAGVIDSGYRGDIGVILFNSQYNNSREYFFVIELVIVVSAIHIRSVHFFSKISFFRELQERNECRLINCK